METTELEDLTKKVNAYIINIDNRLDLIKSNNEKLKNWSNLRKSVTQNVRQTDEAVLKEMIGYFGEGCLKKLILDIADMYINDFESKITSQSCDLKMVVKPKP
jgi:hypothetical protein